MIVDLLKSERLYAKSLAKDNYLSATVIQGDAQTVLNVLPDESVQSVITSPPYWSTRDYKIRGQLGLENSPIKYIDHLVSVFETVRRVLKKDGVLWINIGDVYASGNRKYRAPDTKYPQRAMASRPPTPIGVKSKDLIGIPWRLAFALQANGWYLRTEIVWNKTNAMPESVRDRPQRSHEYLFLFSKSLHYKFSRSDLEFKGSLATRSVWNIPTSRSTCEGHHAVFPERLVLPCIRATTKKNDLILDPFCGTGTVGSVCHLIKRKFIGIELNPRYARASVHRLGPNTNWLKVTRLKANQKTSNRSSLLQPISASSVNR